MFVPVPFSSIVCISNLEIHAKNVHNIIKYKMCYFYFPFCMIEIIKYLLTYYIMVIYYEILYKIIHHFD